MQITKVKWDGSRIHIEWQVARTDSANPDEHFLKSIDAPTPSFVAAWDKLRGVVVDEAELPAEMAEHIKPIGLSVSYYSDDRWGAMVSATRTLQRSYCPLVLNTPHKPAEPTEGNEDDTHILSGESCDLIDEVLREAGKYVNGERAQQPLFATAGAVA